MTRLGRRIVSGAVSAALAGSLFGRGPALADDRPFAYAYSTDLEAQGEKEIEQQLTWTSGHARAAFQGLESRTEFEYGFTDDFQGSFYLNYDWSKTRNHVLVGPAATASLPGVSAEFIYRFLNVYFDPIGLALYAEPSIGNGTRSFEVKEAQQVTHRIVKTACLLFRCFTLLKAAVID